MRKNTLLLMNEHDKYVFHFNSQLFVCCVLLASKKYSECPNSNPILIWSVWHCPIIEENDT